jgi:hypothetical protein
VNLTAYQLAARLGERFSQPTDDSTFVPLDINLDHSRDRQVLHSYKIVPGSHINHFSDGVAMLLLYQAGAPDHRAGVKLRPAVVFAERVAITPYVLEAIKLQILLQVKIVLLLGFESDDQTLDPHPLRQQDRVESYVATDVIDHIAKPKERNQQIEDTILPSGAPLRLEHAELLRGVHPKLQWDAGDSKSEDPVARPGPPVVALAQQTPQPQPAGNLDDLRTVG